LVNYRGSKEVKYCDAIADMKYGIDPMEDLGTRIEKMRMPKVERDIR